MPSVNRHLAPSIQSLPLLLGALLFAGCGTPRNPPRQPDAQLIADLTGQADAWDKAIIRKDLPAIAVNMTDDFRQIRKNGDLVDKAVFLRDILAPELTIHPYSVEDFDVRLYGDSALLCGRTQMTGTYAGKTFTSHYRYIDTYIRRGGQWKVCSVQITAIPES